MKGQGGRYLEDVHVADTAEPGTRGKGVAPHAVDAELAQRLWTWSEEQIGQPVST